MMGAGVLTLSKFDLGPVELPNLSDVVYNLLRERILRYDFSPGERLDLSVLETSLEVSRTPLKDALTRLEAEGLVEIQPRRGTFVTAISAEKLDDAYKIRSAFELYVALCIFKYLKPEDYAFFDETRQTFDSLFEAAETDGWQGVIHDYLQVDQQLHERFVDRGGTPHMLRLFQQTNVHMHVTRIISRYLPRDLQAMHFEHEQIFAAIDDRSPERLSAALLNHLEASRYRALRYSQAP
jgi:DNA-binding GntR family transcriptional regulator